MGPEVVGVGPKVVEVDPDVLGEEAGAEVVGGRGSVMGSQVVM